MIYEVVCTSLRLNLTVVLLHGLSPLKGKDEKPVNRLIFIGKNLNAEQLQTRFASCLVQKRGDVKAMLGKSDEEIKSAKAVLNAKK